MRILFAEETSRYIIFEDDFYWWEIAGSKLAGELPVKLSSLIALRRENAHEFYSLDCAVHCQYSVEFLRGRDGVAGFNSDSTN